MIENQIKFLEKEKLQIVADFEAKANSKALALLEKEELFLGQFIKVDDNGMMHVAFPKRLGVPMKSTFLWAFILKAEDCNYKAWGDLSYSEIFSRGLDFSSVQCVWKTKGNQPNSILAGFTGLKTEMLQKMNNGSLVVFGPPEPPILYYENLKGFIIQYGLKYGQILDLENRENNWSPNIIENNLQKVGFILNQLKLVDVAMIQGPPGTGKTTLIARLINQIIKDGKSVLVSALANKALIEVAGHSEIGQLLQNDKIFKTNLTEDERKQLPKLQNLKNPEVLKGRVVLSTFYKSSSLFEQFENAKFDFVIVDEASQAFIGTLAGFKHIGKKNIWVGDQNQLPPVVRLNKTAIEKLGADGFIHGFETVCRNNLYPGFMMNKSFRFGKRAASLTGIFYGNNLESAKSERELELGNLQHLFHPEGGPFIHFFDLKLGSKMPFKLLSPLKKILSELVGRYPYEVLIVAPFLKTVNWLEKELSEYTSPKLSISTIDKIQGKNTDICILILPNTRGLYSFVLDRNRFNVATSRAKFHTLILADKGVGEFVSDRKVKEYINSLAKS